MDMSLFILMVVVLVAGGLKLYRPALYLVFGKFIEDMVRSAEQQYKEANGKINRRALARQQIYKVFTFVHLKPDKWVVLIEWLIDAAITRLPKTDIEAILQKQDASKISLYDLESKSFDYPAS